MKGDLILHIHNNIFIPSLMGDWLVEVRGIELEYSFAENGQKLDRYMVLQ